MSQLLKCRDVKNVIHEKTKKEEHDNSQNIQSQCTI